MPYVCVWLCECRWFRPEDWRRVLYQMATALILVAILLPIMMLMMMIEVMVVMLQLLIASRR